MALVYMPMPGVKQENPPLKYRRPNLQHATPKGRTPIGWRDAFKGNFKPFVRTVFPARAILCELANKDLITTGAVDPILGRTAVAF